MLLGRSIKPFFFLLGAVSLFGQGPFDKGNPPEMVIDRPDVTEASTVVPRGSLQIENGATFSRGDASVMNLTESLFRLGVARRTEIRFNIPQYEMSFDRGVAPAGFDDVSVGFKQQLGPLPGDIDLSVIVAVSLPTGSNAVSSHGYDPFVKFPWSRELRGGWSIGGMQSVFWRTEDRQRNVTWEPTLYLERQLGKRTDVFAEYAGDYPQRGGAGQIAHFGGAFKLTAHTLLDMHFGFGLSAASPDQFVGIGYSVRFDGLWR